MVRWGLESSQTFISQFKVTDSVQTEVFHIYFANLKRNFRKFKRSLTLERQTLGHNAQCC